MAKINFSAIPTTEGGYSGNGSNVSFFSLKNDGDEAIVRIMHDTPDDFEVLTVHPVKIGNNFRSVNCLRDPSQPVDNCPLCKNNTKLQHKIYIRMIQYVRNEQGQIEAKPVVWERPAQAYGTQLANLINEYGPLSECVFKIRRNGAPRDMKTTYDIMFGNPNMYTEAHYPKVAGAFDNYTACGTSVMDKSFDEVCTFIATGAFPAKNGGTTPNVNGTVAEKKAALDMMVDQAPPAQQSNNNWGTAQSTSTGAPARPTRYY